MNLVLVRDDFNEDPSEQAGNFPRLRQRLLVAQAWVFRHVYPTRDFTTLLSRYQERRFKKKFVIKMDLAVLELLLTTT